MWQVSLDCSFGLPLSCVPNVTGISGLLLWFTSVLCAQCDRYLWIAPLVYLCLVCPMWQVSLDCSFGLPLSCVPNVTGISGLLLWFTSVLCAQCDRYLWIAPLVYLCLVCPMWQVSLDCSFGLPLSCVPNVTVISGMLLWFTSVLCAQCDRYLWIAPLVYLCLVCPMWQVSLGCSFGLPLPCVPNVTGISGLLIWFTSVLCAQCDRYLWIAPLVYLCLVCPMWQVSLDCSSGLPLSCVPNVTGISGLLLWFTSVLCAQCDRYLWIAPLVYLCLVCPMWQVSLDYSFGLPLSCVPNVTGISGLLLWFTSVLCAQCDRYLWIAPLVYLCLVCPMWQLSLDCSFGLPLSCVPSVTGISGLLLWFTSVLCAQCDSYLWIAPLVYLCLVCPMWQVSLDCSFGLPLSCVPNVTGISGLLLWFTPVLCSQCDRYLWIGPLVYLCLVCPMWQVSLDCSFGLPLSCVPNVTGISGLLLWFTCLVCPMWQVSLDYSFGWTLSCVPNVTGISGLLLWFTSVLCAQCNRYLWIAPLVYLYLVCPIWQISLDCSFGLPLSCVPNVTGISGLLLWFISTLCAQCDRYLWIAPLVYLYLVCPMWQVSLDCSFGLPLSCVPNVTGISGLLIWFTSVLCAQCDRYLWIAPLGYLCLVCPM